MNRMEGTRTRFIFIAFKTVSGCFISLLIALLRKEDPKIFATGGPNFDSENTKIFAYTFT